MRKKIILLSLIALIILPRVVSGDVIYLYDGEIYSGKIIRENSTFVRIDTLRGDDGRIKEFLRTNIATIKYGIMPKTENTEAPVSIYEKDEIIKTFRKSIQPFSRRELESEEKEIINNDTQELLPALQEPIEEVDSIKQKLAAPVAPEMETREKEIKRIVEAVQLEEQIHQDIEVSDMSDERVAQAKIAEAVQLEEQSHQDIEEIDMSDEQVAQMENQVQKMMQPKNVISTILMIIGSLITVSALPILICVIIGFILARKFDGNDVAGKVLRSVLDDERKRSMGITSRNTAIVRTSFESPYPTKEIPVEPKVQPKEEKKEAKRGGLIRRVIARTVDLYLGIGCIMVIYSLPGLFVPLDKFSIMLMFILMLPLMLFFFLYFFLGIWKLPNTYGRYLVNIQVVDKKSGKRPSFGQAFKRDFILFLWPIDFFVLMFSKGKRRIGDCWANTKVVVSEMQNFWLKRLIPGLVIGIGIYSFLPVASPFINDRMVITQAAKAYLTSEYGEEMLTRPQRVEIFNDEGRVNMKLKNGESYSVHLKQYQGKWAVRKIHKIPPAFLGKGYSIRYGS